MEKIRRLMGGGNPEEKLIFTGERVFVPAYRSKDFLDEKRLDSEISQLARGYKKAQDLLKATPYPIKAKSAEEAKKIARWLESERRTEELEDCGLRINEELEQGGREGILTHQEIYRDGLLLTVAAFLTLDELKRQQRFAEDFGVGSLYQPVLAAQAQLTCGEVDIHIGGLSLEDFHSLGVKRLPKVALLRFFVESDRVRGRRLHDEVLQENQQPLYAQHPNFAKAHIETVSGVGLAMSGLLPEDLDSFASSSQGLTREITQKARELLVGVSQARKEMFQAVLNPSSPDFPVLKDELSRYLKMGRRERVKALHVVGLNWPQNIYVLYRKVQGYIQAGIETDFCQLLSDSILKFVEEMPTEESILTEKEVSIVLDLDRDIEPAQVPQATEFKQIIRRIFSFSSLSAYTLSPEQVNWANILSTSEVRVAFDRNQPLRFVITLPYESETGEQTEVKVSFDTAKDLFHWTFIEMPKGEGEAPIEKMYRSVLVLTKSALSKVEKLAQEAYQERRKEREIKPVVETGRPKKVKPSGIEEAGQIAVEKRRTLTQAAKTVEFSVETPPEGETGIHTTILLPEENTFEKVTRYLSNLDRDIVREAIEKLNQKGLGEFKQLKNRSKKSGKILFSLDVGATGGRVRVLAVAGEHQPNERRYEIEDIRYRKDVYRKNLSS